MKVEVKLTQQENESGDWNLVPERVAPHPDPATRGYFSHWNLAQCEWVASGFTPDVPTSMPQGHQ